MTTQEFQALWDAAQGLILFHNGLWGAPTCYMWAGPDGREAGRVPSWEAEVLERLHAKRLTAIRPGKSTADTPVVATEAGWELLAQGRSPKAA